MHVIPFPQKPPEGCRILAYFCLKDKLVLFLEAGAIRRAWISLADGTEKVILLTFIDIVTFKQTFGRCRN